MIASPAFADGEPVRDDIVELRHHRLPEPFRFLGWTADGRAVMHVSQCGFQDASGAPECGAGLDVAEPDGSEHMTSVLEPEVDCRPDIDSVCGDFPWRVSTMLASRAIRAEASALASLGPLQASASAATPVITASHTACSVSLVADRRRTIAHFVAIGPAMCITNGHDMGIRDVSIVDVHWSPDASKLAIRLAILTNSLDSYATFVRTLFVDGRATKG